MEQTREPDEYTGKLYSHVSLEGLAQRGVENDLINSLVKLGKGVMVAGSYPAAMMAGDMRLAKDVDVFFTDAVQFASAMNSMVFKADPVLKDYKLDTHIPEGFKDMEVWKKARYVTYKAPNKPSIQFIKVSYYRNPSHLIDTFDFTVAQFAARGKEMVFNPMGLVDLYRKRLVPHRITYPASSLRRMLKYSDKGYYACPGALATIAAMTADTLAKHPERNNDDVYID